MQFYLFFVYICIDAGEAKCVFVSFLSYGTDCTLIAAVSLMKSLMKGYWLSWNIDGHLNDKNTKHIVIH